MSLRRKLDRYSQEQLSFMIRKKLFREKRREKVLKTIKEKEKELGLR